MSTLKIPDNAIEKIKFTEAQMVFVLRQVDTGISEATYSNRKKKYGGLGMSELRRLKQLEEEN